MRMHWKSAPLILLLALMLLSNGISSTPHGKLKLPYDKRHTGFECMGCVLAISIVEQLVQVHNSTAKDALKRLCGFLPEKLNLHNICFLILKIFGPTVIKLIESKKKADVICYSIRFCQQQTGQPLCRLYPPSPQVRVNVAVKESERMVAAESLKITHGLASICSLHFLRNLCKMIEYSIKNKLPYEDIDGDKFSTLPTLRGYHWRGKDCDDRKASIHPGKRPDNWDSEKDSNCNGIWGIDPKDGIPYEQKFCNDTDSKGIIVLGDSAAAHFHIPPEWLTASKMSKKAFSNIVEVLTNEFDWPQFSGTTGFLNSTNGGWTESFYLNLRGRNRCNHRDYQQLSKNGGSSGNVLDLLKSLARSQQFDKPAIVIFSMIGNDVCNGRSETVKYMTSPDQMHINVVQILQYLDSHLPKGSHVILTGLVDGSFLWDNMHNRYHPLGELNKDVTYEQLYSFLSCLQVSPCNGWMTSNSTLRDLTSERAAQLSNVLKEIAMSEKYMNFDVLYVDYPLKEIAERWQEMGGEAWQLIEPVDGFHPNQIAAALGARILWEKILREWPYILGKENPFNSEIAAVFKDQGGH